ncbi:predicted protein [Histoplasma capsulatum H143]|uniref:Uncharacterized protein n=1 Tax=Ajellomyces capsulatus (strain H143) TaxID=544712 RepID=C6HIB7_AJECH|nr:predicted protein [Histoplasma capsulatum H143]
MAAWPAHPPLGPGSLRAPGSWLLEDGAIAASEDPRPRDQYLSSSKVGLKVDRWVYPQNTHSSKIFHATGTLGTTGLYPSWPLWGAGGIIIHSARLREQLSLFRVWGCWLKIGKLHIPYTHACAKTSMNE